MSSQPNAQKRRQDKARYYANSAKKARLAKFQLVPDLKGFLLFCNKHERETIREAYNLLNEFADELYGPEKVAQDASDGRASDEEEDVDAALEKERAMLSASSKQSVAERRFQVVDSCVQNVLFVRTTVNDPVELASAIMADIEKTKKQRTRFLLRLVPVERTCKAFDENVAAACKHVLPKWFADKDKVSYCIFFKARLNNNFSKEDAVDIVGKAVREINSSATVEYKNPDLSIILEVMKSHCCVAVVPNYFKYKKFNVIELASNESKEEVAEDLGSKSSLVTEINVISNNEQTSEEAAVTDVSLVDIPTE